MSKKRKHNQMKDENKPITEEQVADNELNEQVDEQSVPTDTESPESEQTTPSADDKIAELTERCADLADKNLRMMAEFDNFRRRTAKEKLELQKTAGEQIFKEMLSLVDDFERARQAMQQTDDVASVREGVELIYQKFIGFLEKNDVHRIDTENADFDTTYHEAVTTFPAPAPEQKGKVIDCTQNGYMLGDKVIRYAKVVVGE
ncbi:MAG: nucleotide exchange factor GrpE [Paludibacteraceae bacterium]|nr:nucleotide exchange factor GrpE [Paludibacteraceae bacterium]